MIYSSIRAEKGTYKRTYLDLLSILHLHHLCTGLLALLLLLLLLELLHVDSLIHLLLVDGSCCIVRRPSRHHLLSNDLVLVWYKLLLTIDYMNLVVSLKLLLQMGLSGMLVSRILLSCELFLNCFDW